MKRLLWPCAAFVLALALSGCSLVSCPKCPKCPEYPKAPHSKRVAPDAKSAPR